MENTPLELIKATSLKIDGFLKAKYPDYVKFGEDTYTIAVGSTQVMILVRPYTESETIIEFVSHIVFDANLTADLMQYLLRKNSELHFGAFGLLFDGTISYSYSLAGSNLDENEFIVALDSVAIIADYYDDEIIAMSGGKRFMDVNAE